MTLTVDTNILVYAIDPTDHLHLMTPVELIALTTSMSLLAGSVG